MCSTRSRENPAVALLMGPAPASWLGWVAGRALAEGEWSPPASSMAAGRGGCPSQWGAASPAEAISAEPATVAVAHVVLCRSAAAIGDGLRCRVGVLAGAKVSVPVGAAAGALVRAEAGPPVPAEAGTLVRAGAGALVRAEGGALVRAGAGTLVRAGAGALVRAGAGALVRA